MDLTRNLSNEKARNNELLARLSTEAEDRQVQLQHHGRGEREAEVVLRKQQDAGEVSYGSLEGNEEDRSLCGLVEHW
jgi:hypothetical protein